MRDTYCCTRCREWFDTPSKWAVGKTVWQGIRIPVFYDGLHVEFREYELCPDCYRLFADFLEGNPTPKADGGRCPKCGHWPVIEGGYCSKCGAEKKAVRR